MLNLKSRGISSAPAFYGEYYSAPHSKGPKPCRSVLDISLNGLSLEDLHQGKPDLYVIMMNPGGSYPKCAVEPKEWHRDEKYKLGLFFEAIPDATQLQIVEVMRNLKAPSLFARVYNLTNYCEPQSSKLFEPGEEFLRQESVFGSGKPSLSIPSKARVLKAWGVRPRLRVLKDLVKIPGVGVLKAGTLDCYRHPLPRNADDQKRWIDLAVKALNQVENVCWNKEEPLDG